MRENPTVQARFLLGPAGSGKTFRCLGEVRAALAGDSAGDPLVLLAPKQATFQLERQLLADGGISGFTRLHVFSGDKLARYIGERLQVALPKMLSAEGRVMVLHEDGQRVQVVTVNLHGANAGAFTRRAQQALAHDIQWPPGTYPVFGGDAAAQSAATLPL